MGIHLPIEWLKFVNYGLLEIRTPFLVHLINWDRAGLEPATLTFTLRSTPELSIKDTLFY